jgi:hypothetical protein
VADLLSEAAEGRFPPADGTILVVPPPPGPTEGVVAFSAHNVVAADVSRDEVLAALPSDDPGAPMSAAFLGWLSGKLGTPAGMIDLVMVAPRVEPSEDLPKLVRRADLGDHPRVARARQYREDVVAYSDPDDRATVVIGRGLALRWEMAIELEPSARGTGLGRALARAATQLIPEGEHLFAQVTPGNVASIRAFLAAGYRPICSEVLFLRPK